MRAVRRWLGRAAFVALLLLGARSLWIEASKYRLREVPPSAVPAVVPVGARVLVSRAEMTRLAVGDIIDFRHPTSPSSPLYLRVASISRSRMSSGYGLTLETGVPGSEAWHAEMVGTVWRVDAMVWSPSARHSTNVLNFQLLTRAETRVD